MSYTKQNNYNTNGTELWRWGSIIALFLVVSFGGLVAINTAFASELPTFQYEHTPPDGLIANQRTTVSMFIDATEEIQNVRLYFRPFSVSEYFFIELHPDVNGNYTGELPAFDESVTSLEYLYLWENGSRRIVRTTPYNLSQVTSGALSKSIGAPITIFTEIEDGTTEELDNLTREMFALEKIPEDQHYGMRVGLFDMSGDKRYRYGYFGGYLYETDKNVTYAIKGYVNFETPIRSQSDSKTLDQQSLSQTPDGYPNVAGDDWTGVFYRTDSSSRTSITAIITHNGNSWVTVTTSLTGRGHYLSGYISSGNSGELYLWDLWDGEIWTTHSLNQSTSVYFGFEDYVYPSTIFDPSPPLWRIILTRPEPIEPVNWLPPILELLLLD